MVSKKEMKFLYFIFGLSGFLLILKLFGVINWSYFWVFSPILFYALLFVIIFIFIFALLLLNIDKSWLNRYPK